jgi:hypothetical protein
MAAKSVSNATRCAVGDGASVAPAPNMSMLSCFAGGLVGSTVLTLTHQVGRNVFSDAPRMDEVGMRALARGLQALGARPPARDRLYRWTLASDLVANAAYYGLAGIGPARGIWRRAAVLGTAAGAGALVLPRRMGLGDPPASESRRNQFLTVAYYTVGALAAAAALAAMSRRPVPRLAA